MIRNERMSRKFNFKELVLVLTIFTMLYMSSSYNIAIISGTLTLGISFICSVLVILVCKKDVINMRLLLIVILLNITVFVTTILTGDAIRDAIIMCSSILIAMIFVTQIKFEKYCIISCFVKIPIKLLSDSFLITGSPLILLSSISSAAWVIVASG